jgi:hypothetical protein
MADTNYRSDGAAHPLDNLAFDLTPEELKIIGYFAQGQKHSIASQNLKLEYTETSIRLSNSNCKLLGISKQVNQWQRKVLVSNNSVYRSSLVAALTASGFITKQKSSHPEFTEHHYYQIPDGYKLNYTESIELWKIWWNNKRYQLNAPSPPIDVLIFSKGDWYSVQDLQPKQGSFILKTAKKETNVDPEEYVVWINQAESNFVVPPHFRSLQQPSVQLDSNRLSEGNIPTEVLLPTVQPMAQLELPVDRRSLNVGEITTDSAHRPSLSDRGYINELPEPEEDLDLESYLSTFNTEDSEDIDRIEGIYNIGELLSGNNMLDDVTPPPPPRRLTSLPSPASAQIGSSPVEPPASPEQPVTASIPVQPILSILQRQALLKGKAIHVLATYLQEGDRITQTEVLKNAQGQEINRKVTKIQRGCPSWAIDQIKKVES